jgi:hypothetical protein
MTEQRPEHGPARPAPEMARQADRRAFGRMMSLWASDLLSHPPGTLWPEPVRPEDDVNDYRCRDWRRLYDASVLDD